MRNFNKIKKGLETLVGYNLHINNENDFFDMMKKTNIRKFDPLLLEKDFLLTAILIYISNELPLLRFKWWTCLNKIYFPYYRLSEDLDFTIPIDEEAVNTEKKRFNYAHKVREKIKYIASIMWWSINPDIEQHKRAFWNKYLKNKKYTYLKYLLEYPSLYDWSIGKIKIEVTYTSKQYIKSKNETIKSLYLDTVLEEPIFWEKKIQCLDINEMIAEKCRAALTRREPAIRDFFDLWYLKSQWIDIFKNIDLIVNKCKENTELVRTIINNYGDLQQQLQTDLHNVLSQDLVLQWEWDDKLKSIYDNLIELQKTILSKFE